MILKKNLAEFQRISHNFEKFLQTDMLPIIEGKLFIHTHVDYLDM